MIRFIESWSFWESWIVIEWQLSAGDGLFELGLLFGYTVRSRKPFLPLGYPSVDIFGRVQGYVSPLDDDGLSGNGLGLVAGKDCM